MEQCDILSLIYNSNYSITVKASFAQYSHSSGDIEEYDAQSYARGKVKDVYTYYGALFNHREAEVTEIPDDEDEDEILDVQV